MNDHAAEVTARLREDDSELGLAHDEAICPVCSLAYFVPTGGGGVCRDCKTDLIALN